MGNIDVQTCKDVSRNVIDGIKVGLWSYDLAV